MASPFRHHDLSHHGQDPVKIAQLKILELEKMKTLRDFLTQLRETKEEGESLLDRTMVFFSSNLGNASTHSARNLPVVLAGGGFKHGQHLAFDPVQPPPILKTIHRKYAKRRITVSAIRADHATSAIIRCAWSEGRLTR